MDSKHSLGVYLGASVDIQDSRIRHFTPLLDLVSKKLSQWTQRSLSQATKVIIINSILIASLLHHLSIFRIPGAISNKIDSLLARFFWTNQYGQGIHWCRRSIIHLPKGRGGLGIRNVRAMNEALLMKSAWRIMHNPQILVSKIYARGRSISDHWHASKSSVSWGERSLRFAYKTLMQHCPWKVGSGNNIKVVSDNWVCGKPPVCRDEIPLRTVATLKVADLVCPQTKDWNVRKIFQLFVPTSARDILEIELPKYTNPEDSRYWPYTASGNYTTKTGYDQALQHQQNDICSMTSTQQERFFRILWSLNIMPKWKFFLWKLHHNRLATGANLVRRGIGTSSACPICLEDVETTYHMFLTCPLAMEAWTSYTPLTPPAPNQGDSVSPWLEVQILQLHSSEGLAGPLLPKFVGTLWAIWLTRNGQIFRHIRASKEAFQSHLDTGQKQHMVFTTLDLSILSPDIGCGPPPGFNYAHFGSFTLSYAPLIIRIDGAWDKITHRAVAAWVAELHSHVSTARQAHMFRSTSAVQTEAMACLLAIQWAVSTSAGNIIIYTDSNLLVGFLADRIRPSPSVSHTVRDIQRMASSFEYCRVMKVTRDEVAPAHNLAKRCKEMGVPIFVS